MVDAVITILKVRFEILVDHYGIIARFQTYTRITTVFLIDIRHCAYNSHDLPGVDWRVWLLHFLLVFREEVTKHKQSIVQAVFLIIGKHGCGDICKFVKVE